MDQAPSVVAGRAEYAMIQVVTSGGNTSCRLALDELDIKGEGWRAYPRLVVPLRIRLEAPLTGKEDGSQEFVMAGRCGLFIPDMKEKVADGLLLDLGQPVNAGSDTGLRFEFPLDPLRVRLVEERRKGDVRLRFGIQLSMLGGKSTAFPIAGGVSITGHSAINPHALYAHMENVTIPQSHWVKNVLPAWELFDYFLVEVPRGATTIEAAWKYVASAEAAFSQWDMKSLAANCREVGKVLDAELKGRLGAENLDYSVKWVRALHRFGHFVSWPLHLEDNRKQLEGHVPEATKADGEFLLLNTKALVKYAQELLELNSSGKSA